MNQSNILASDRYVIASEAPRGGVVFVYQLIDGNILRCPAKWDAAAQSYQIVSENHLGNRTAAMYPPDSPLVAALNGRGIRYTLQVGGPR